MTIFNKRVVWLYLCLAGLFIVDRVVKWLALNVIPREGIFIIPKSTGLILERNQGIAYSIVLPQALLLTVVIIILLVLMYLLIRAYKGRLIENVAAYGLIIIGAFSNLLDRLRYEYVIDMIVLTSWPVFNLADIFILAGAVWLILRFIITGKSRKAV